MNLRSFNLLFAAAFALHFIQGVASAQWRTESFPNLRAGWNAIFLFVDTGELKIDDLLASYPQILEVWRWDPTALDPEILDAPDNPIEGREWKVWRRGGTGDLSEFSPNFAYLIRVDESASAFTLGLKGKAISPRVSWRRDGLNLVGFPIGSTERSPHLRHFLAPMGGTADLSETFEYVGGPLLNGSNPALVNRNERADRGRAYWIRTTEYSDFYGPLKVEVALNDGLDFGESGVTARIVLSNRTSETLSATLEPAPSETAPGSVSVSEPVALLRREFDGQGYSFEPFAGAHSIQIEPNSSQGLTVAVDRNASGVTPGQEFASLLKVTDGLDQTEIYLPVRARAPSLEGLWVGEARISHVQNQLQRLQRSEDGNYLVGRPPQLRISSVVPAKGHAEVVVVRGAASTPPRIVIFDSFTREVVNQQLQSGAPADTINGLLPTTNDIGELEETDRQELLRITQETVSHTRSAEDVALDGKFVPQLDGNGDPIGPDNGTYKTAQTFPLRLVLHNDGSTVRLIGRAFYGGGVTTLAEQPDSRFRVSAAHLPTNASWNFNGSNLAAGSDLQTLVQVGHNSPHNPFVHTYHPDHDNLNARFESTLGPGEESFQIDRTIRLEIDSSAPDTADPGWGTSLFTGIYLETVKLSGKNAEAFEVAVSGVFAIRRIPESRSQFIP